jgi:hypothetical protein
VSDCVPHRDVLNSVALHGLLKYRGRRAGTGLQRRILPITNVNKQTTERCDSNRTCALRRIAFTPASCSTITVTNSIPLRTSPTLYVVNAAAVTKPHAIEQLTADLIGYSVDVALVSESHLKSKHSSDTFSIADYELFRRDRSGRRGGGVMIYAKTSLQPTVWKQPSDNEST